MKKIIVTALVAVSISLVSCDKNEVDPISQDLATADFATGGGGTQRGGGKPQLTDVAIESLSNSITDYINSNYAGANIDKAGTDAEGNFAIGITLEDGSHKGLLFDSSGAFLNELQGKKGDGKGGDRPPLTEIVVTDLSGSITSYISTNYPDSEIEKAGSDPEGNIVVIISGVEHPMALLFDATGTFQKELQKPGGKGKRPPLTEVDIKSLSSAITSYISSNYPDGAIEKAGTDVEGNILVRVVTGDSHVGLLFNSAGAFQKVVAPPGQ